MLPVGRRFLLVTCGRKQIKITKLVVGIREKLKIQFKRLYFNHFRCCTVFGSCHWNMQGCSAGPGKSFPFTVYRPLSPASVRFLFSSHIWAFRFVPLWLPHSCFPPSEWFCLCLLHSLHTSVWFQCIISVLLHWFHFFAVTRNMMATK